MRKFSNTIQAEFSAASLGSGYGSSQEFTQEDLREYHYMFGMPYLELIIDRKRLLCQLCS